MPDWIFTAKSWSAFPFLVLMLLLEGWIPLFAERRRSLRHDVRNIAMALLNAIPLSLISATLTTWTSESTARHGWGLFHHVSAPTWIVAMTAILVFDFLMYGWHRANHRIPFFWRFHRMHHSDPDVDATSALRFHMGEVIFGALVRLPLLPLMGFSAWNIVLYDVILLPVIIFHHSSIRLAPRLDKVLRAVIVTPGIHQVHHSDLQPETDSNYSSVFSWWDRLFGTLRLREDNSAIRFGLKAWDAPDLQTVAGMLGTPWRKSDVSAKPEISPVERV